MDPALLREHAAFKKRAAAVPVVENTAPKVVQQKETKTGAPKPKKKKSKFSRPKPQLITGLCRSINSVYNSHMVDLR